VTRRRGEEMRRRWQAGVAELSAATTLSAAAELSTAVPGRRLGKWPTERKTSSCEGRGVAALGEEVGGRWGARGRQR
jgi:hypothetical protein